MPFWAVPLVVAAACLVPIVHLARRAGAEVHDLRAAVTDLKALQVPMEAVVADVRRLPASAAGALARPGRRSEP